MPSKRFQKPPDPDTRKVANRKALQLAAQVAETLSQVLQGECDDEVLRDLLVMSVVPAPDSTQLLVTVSLAPSAGTVSTAEVMEHLQKARGKLRSEVALAIHRRKTPELLFTFVDAKMSTIPRTNAPH
jgi:ribosome-binding factor A